MNDNELKYLKDSVKGRTCQELADLMNKRFHTNRFKASSIKHYKRKHNLVSGVDSRFKKNQIPHNKKETGYEFVDKKTGYTYIKTSNSGWMLKHRFIWERHNGRVPDGYSVVFLDQDKNNFDIDNLCKVSRHQLLLLNQHKLIYNNNELTKAGIEVVNLIIKTREIKKNEKKS